MIPKPGTIEMARENFAAQEISLTPEEMTAIAKLNLHLKCSETREKPYSEDGKFEIPLFR